MLLDDCETLALKRQAIHTENAIIRYLLALETGDTDTIERMLEESAFDERLAILIAKLHRQLRRGDGVFANEDD